MGIVSPLSLSKIFNVQAQIINNTYRITYKSLGEFLNDTEKAPFPSDAHSDNESDYNEIRNERSCEWRYGSEKLVENYYDERFKPDKGRRLCQNDLNKMLCSKEYKDSLKIALTYKKRLNFKEEGNRISVPRALTGDDKCFITSKTSRKPTVKIAINMCVSACVDDQGLMKIAMSAIPVVFALEQAGICTEIWLCGLSTGTHEDIDHTLVEVCIKTAQQRFSWTTFAPVFQAGTYRHGMFLTWLRAPYSATYGYGSPMRDDTMKENDNYGYVSIIGNHAPGPLETVREIFKLTK